MGQAKRPPAQDLAQDHVTRTQILRLVLSQGPISAVQLAKTLGLASAGIRRHLGVLEVRGLIEDHRMAPKDRGRGRPARYFVATPRAHQALQNEAHTLAVEALSYLGDVAGRDAIGGFASRRGGEFEQRYTPRVLGAGEAVEERATALAKALNDDGFAASVRPGPGGLTLQLCQGHCPVHQVAAVFPEICEAETQAISRMLGVHVQRLATLAGGEHVCTTCVPVDLAVGKKGAV
jgi:predicted ArsR family transcriptional regulator